MRRHTFDIKRFLVRKVEWIEGKGYQIIGDNTGRYWDRYDDARNAAEN